MGKASWSSDDKIKKMPWHNPGGSGPCGKLKEIDRKAKRKKNKAARKRRNS